MRKQSKPEKEIPEKNHVGKYKDLSWSNGSSGRITVARASQHNRLDLMSLSLPRTVLLRTKYCIFTKFWVADDDLVTGLSLGGL